MHLKPHHPTAHNPSLPSSILYLCDVLSKCQAQLIFVFEFLADSEYSRRIEFNDAHETYQNLELFSGAFIN